MLMLFEDQKHQYFARRHSLNTHFDNSKKQKRNQRGNKRLFFVSLVDTRSYISIEKQKIGGIGSFKTKNNKPIGKTLMTLKTQNRAF